MRQQNGISSSIVCVPFCEFIFIFQMNIQCDCVLVCTAVSGKCLTTEGCIDFQFARELRGFCVTNQVKLCVYLITVNRTITQTRKWLICFKNQL